MIFGVMSASAQLTENIITGIRAYIMQKQQSVAHVDEQHRNLVSAIISHDEELAENCMKVSAASIQNNPVVFTQEEIAEPHGLITAQSYCNLRILSNLQLNILQLLYKE